LTKDVNDRNNLSGFWGIRMKIFWIRTESGEDFWGPYVERSLADRVLKIVCMAGYEDAEIAVAETDEYSRELLAGLLPWKIVVETEDGQLMKTTCSLTWPPEDHEGIIRGEADNSGEYETVEHFAWAKTEVQAKRRIAQLGAAPKAKAEA
jgi:hypothetical protein